MYLCCITVASFAVLVQPAVVAQTASTTGTLPPICPTHVLEGDGSQTYPCEKQHRILQTDHEARITTQGLLRESVTTPLPNTNPLLIHPTQVLYGDGSQTCRSEEQGIKMLKTYMYHEDKEATQGLLQGSVVPFLQTQLSTEFSCGGPAGWRCVAYLNMTDPSQQCPSVWQEITTPHRVCGRRSSSGGCEGLNYTTGSEQYNHCAYSFWGVTLHELHLPDNMGFRMYLSCIALASFTVLAQPSVAQGGDTTLPLTYPGQVLQGDGSQTCPSEERRQMLRNEIKNATQTLLGESVATLLQASPADHPCSGTGWRRVAYLNMTDPSQQCPSVWQEITTPHRVCGRRSSSGGCEGLTYTTGSEQYDQVCGRIIGYQLGIPNAFCANGRSLDTNYVNGISVTHGSPRQHIWTFAAGVDEQIGVHKCPCIIGNTAARSSPSFVGQNYFCETGVTQWPGTYGVFYPNGDPLWDGQGCGPISACCTFNSPPWFNITLSPPTTDDIEVRICDNVGIQTADSPIQLMELYVK